MAKKIFITAALTGAMTPKSANPNIPLTPKEIAEDAVRVWKAGAACVHLHMRDENARGTMDPALFRETVQRIRDNTDLILNLTTSGGPTKTDEERWVHVIENKPEMCTYDCGSFNWLPGGPYINSTEFLTNLGKVCQENGVKPEIECFDVGQINAAKYFLKIGALQAPLHFDFVLGVNGAAQATPEMVALMKDMLPEGSTWGALGIGSAHLPIILATLAHGGHLRVGLEDNIYYAKGQLASNTDLVARAARLIVDGGYEVATPDEAREILSLPVRK